jgi:hypothetical protein
VAVAQNMSETAGILNKMAKDVSKRGWPALEEYQKLIGKNISQEEVWVIARYPHYAFHWLGVHRRVYEVVEHMVDKEEQNSVRHVYWQCLLKKRLGEKFAIEMSEAHEKGRPGSADDNAADEINNRIGLKLADDVDNEDECLARTRVMWQEGKLATRPNLQTDPT